MTRESTKEDQQMSADCLSAVLFGLHDEANRCARLADCFGLRAVQRKVHGLRIHAVSKADRELANELLALIDGHLADSTAARPTQDTRCVLAMAA